MDQNMKDQLVAAADHCRAHGMLAAETAIYEAIRELEGEHGEHGKHGKHKAKKGAE